MTAEKPVLSARGFSKTFGGRTVLRKADIDIARGEIHGLLGQNGSGKSTFIKVLAGFHAPDAGASLTLSGREVPLPMPPGEPRKLGMSFVHQDLALIGSATVLENLRIGRYKHGRFGRVRWRSEHKSAQKSLEGFGLSIDPRTYVSELNPIDRALVAILRAMEELQSATRGLLVLDEATAYLPRDGIDRLFAATRQVATRGFGVLFVTHRLDEVRTIADGVTILRDGRVVGSGKMVDFSERDLINRILGFDLDSLYPEANANDAAAGQRLVLSVRDLGGPTVRGFGLDLKPGEIVGLTGLVGTGFEEIPYLLFGARRAASGTLAVNGHEVSLSSHSPAQAMARGLALLPSNRARDGSLASATVLENLTLATLSEYFRRGILRRRQETRTARKQLQDFDVRPPEPQRQFATLSGGNQQKTLLGKWFAVRPRVFLLDEPTQGVDVGARRQIFGHLRRAADQDGTAFLIASTEAEDLAHLCDRVLIFRDGIVTSELSGDDLSEKRITEQYFVTPPRQ